MTTAEHQELNRRYWNGQITLEQWKHEMRADAEKPDGMAALVIAIAKQEWPSTMDAQVWADKWIEHITANPSIATDRATMLGWFANAIMAGYDTATFRLRRSEVSHSKEN